MAGSTVRVMPNWLDPEALLNFIDELRAADFNIGVAQYVAAQDLIAALVARDEPLHDPRRLRTLLGPILCGSPTEQADFQQRFDNWLERMGYEPERPLTETAVSLEKELEDLDQTSIQWQLWVLAAIIGLILLLLIFGLVGPLNLSGIFGSLNISSGSSSGIELPTTPNIAMPELPSWWLLLLFGPIITILMAWRLWWRYRARLFLERRATNQQPRIEQLSISQLNEEIFPKVLFFRLSQYFRRRIEQPSKELDVAETVSATVRQGGWFSPVYGRRQVPPEYLVLIDRASFGDHQAKYVETMVNRLGQNEVFITQYFFDGDPRLCFPADGGQPRPLRHLITRYSQHRLILFTDAARFFNPRTGRLEMWTELFNSWPDRAVLTPENPRQWGYREQALAHHFMVLPASAAGLLSFINVLHRGEDDEAPAFAGQAPYPTVLRRRSSRWLERAAPDLSEIDTMLTAVRRYLGEAGFNWLAACAVYPELHWNLTLYLGQMLEDEQGEATLTPERLAALARLPWFRHNYMPDWLRVELLLKLPRDQERAVRANLHTLLVTAVQGDIDTFQLEIAQEHGRSLSALARPLLQILARGAKPDSPLKDHVFLTFMAGRKQKPLAVRIPDAINRRLQTRTRRTVPWRFFIIWFFLNALGLGVGWSLFMTLVNSSFAPFLDPVVFGWFIFGILTGLTLTLFQWLAIRQYQIQWEFWVLLSTLGGGIGSAIGFVALGGEPFDQLPIIYAIFLSLGISIPQWDALRKRIENSFIWIFANTIIWIISWVGWYALGSALNLNINFATSFYIFIYATLSGFVMRWLLQHPRTDRAESVSLREQIKGLVVVPTRPGFRMWLQWTAVSTVTAVVGVTLGLIFFVFLVTLPAPTFSITDFYFNYGIASVNPGLAISALLVGILFTGNFVGYGQWRFCLRHRIPRMWIWLIATTFSWALAIIIFIVSYLITSQSLLDVRLYLISSLGIGVVFGLIQWAALRPHYKRAVTWIPFTVVAWFVAWMAAFFGVTTAIIFISTDIQYLVSAILVASLYGAISGLGLLSLEGWSFPRTVWNWLKANTAPDRPPRPTWRFWLAWTLLSMAGLLLGAGLATISFYFLETTGFLDIVQSDLAGSLTIGLLAMPIGVGLGLAEWLLLRSYRSRWIPLSMLGWFVGGAGILLPLSLFDAFTFASDTLIFVIWFLTIGLGIGVFQWLRLRKHFERAWVWIVSNVTGLLIIGGILGYASDVGFSTNMGWFLFLAVPFAFFGLTGGTMRWLLRRPKRTNDTTILGETVTV